MTSKDILQSTEIKQQIMSNDIMANIKETWPQIVFDITSNKGIRKDFKHDKIKNYLRLNDYNLICFHFTRLTDYEIEDIRKNGLRLSTKELFIEKIIALPNIITNKEKEDMISFIKSRNETQVPNGLCCKFGYVDLERDPTRLKYFLKNWGGETLYNYYDQNSMYSKDLKSLRERLSSVSYPCVVVLRSKVYDMDMLINYSALITQGKKNGFDKLSATINMYEHNVEVLGVKKINEINKALDNIE